MTNPNHTDTSRSGDLVERLRGDKYTCRENMGCGTMEFCACATMEDAADRIEALEAEVERLSRIAWLILDACDIMDDGPDESDERMAQERINEAVSLARAALGEKQ